MPIDPAVRRAFLGDTEQSTLAFDRLVEDIVRAPEVPAHEIDAWSETYRFLCDRQGQVKGSRQLTPKELRVLELRASGLQEKQVGSALGISRETVKNHLRRARYKLGAADTVHAVAIAFRRGLLT